MNHNKRAPKQWTQAELDKVSRLRHDWILSNRDGVSPRFETVKLGDKLPRRVIGPHSVVTFANECRSFRQNVWGTWRWNPPNGAYDPATMGTVSDGPSSADNHETVG